jgi:hypothetical protein
MVIYDRNIVIHYGNMFVVQATVIIVASLSVNLDLEKQQFSSISDLIDLPNYKEWLCIESKTLMFKI